MTKEKTTWTEVNDVLGYLAMAEFQYEAKCKPEEKFVMNVEKASTNESCLIVTTLIMTRDLDEREKTIHKVFIDANVRIQEIMDEAMSKAQKLGFEAEFLEEGVWYFMTEL